LRRTGSWIFVTLFFAAIGPGSPSVAAQAAEGASADSLAETPIAWSATYASRYSFQGLDYSEGRSVLQPQVSGSLQGLTLTAWGNLDQTRRELNEIDLSLQRDWSLARLSVALGYAHLRYPQRDWDPTHEVFADLTVEAPLEPSLSVHWDVAAGLGRHWALGVSHTVPWRGGSVALATRLYVHDHYYELTGMPALETSLSASAAWGSIAVQPTLSWIWTWANGDFRDDQAVRGGWVVAIQCSSR